jgi:signal transduction histidine kinase
MDGGSTHRRGYRVVPWAVACAVTVAALLALVAVDRLEGQKRHDAARSQVLSRLNAVRANLEGALTGPLLRTRGMAAQIVAHGDVSPEVFHKVAEVLMAGHRNIRNITLARGSVIALVHPVEGNEGAIGVDYRSQAHQWPAVARAIETRSQVLDGPVRLIQGGTALIGRAPVFLPDDRFFGLVSVVVDIPGVLADAGLENDDLSIAVAIRIDDGAGGYKAIDGNQAVFADRPVQVDALLPGGAWHLAAVPKGGWADAGAGPVRWLGGLLVALLALTSFVTARFILLHDVVDQALRRSNQELEAFAVVASHDLQEPLRMITSYLQLLQRRYGGHLDAEAGEYIAFAVDGARRMQTLILDLLAYSRVDRKGNPFAPVDCAAVIEAVLANLRTAITGSGAQVCVGALPAVEGDAGQLTQLLQNLIGNALKYRRKEVAPRISVDSVLEGRTWTVSVTDNGIGIPAEDAERVFVIFQRLHGRGEYEGTGIGLAICKKIVERHGGRIWVESAPEAGSVFRFTLPGR